MRTADVRAMSEAEDIAAVIAFIALSFTIFLSLRIRGERFASHHQWITAFIIGGTVSLVIAFFIFDRSIFVGAVMTVPFVFGIILLSATISHVIVHEKLSKDFLLKDQQFHKYAGMLEHVSKESHTELVGFYYSKLMESCIGCHSEHAKHRFPIFTNESEKKGHHH